MNFFPDHIKLFEKMFWKTRFVGIFAGRKPMIKGILFFKNYIQLSFNIL